MATTTKVISLQNLERFWVNVQAHYAYIDDILGSSSTADFSALGTGYSSLLALSTTMKNFLTAADASSTAINRWKEDTDIVSVPYGAAIVHCRQQPQRSRRGFGREGGNRRRRQYLRDYGGNQRHLHPGIIRIIIKTA